MVGLLNTIILDSGLTAFHTGATNITVLTTQADTYSHATVAGTYELGIASPGANNTVAAPAADGGTGRQVTVNAIASGGSIGTNGTAAFWAITDGASVLYASYSLSSSQAVTAGNSFTLASFTIDVRGAS